jgi:hypothetical protein
MAHLTKSDLAHSGYKETAYPGDDPRLTGKPDSTLLNRSEAYEMVYFLNRYMTDKGWQQKSTFQKIERFLKSSTYKNQSHKFWRAELDKNFSVNN